MVLSQCLANAQGLVQQGYLTQATTILCNYSNAVSRLDWVATTATAIVGQDHVISARQQALSTLLASEPVSRLFRSDEHKAFSASIRSISPDRFSSQEAAIAHLVGNFPDWETQVMRASLGSVIQAGGLGEIVLQFEQRYGDVSKRDTSLARKSLHRTRRNFVADFDQFQKLPLPEKSKRLEGRWKVPELHREYITGRDQDLNFMHTLFDLAFLRVFLDETYPMHEFYEQGDRPRLLSNYLRSAKDNDDYGNGSCTPSTVMAADLGLRARIDFKFLHHAGHVNLYHQASQLVFEPAPGSRDAVDRLSRFRESGLFGDGQEPAPLEAILTSVATNVTVPEKREVDVVGATRLFAGLEKLYPQSTALSVQQVYLALLQEDRSLAQRALQSGLQTNRHDVRLLIQRFDVALKFQSAERAARTGEEVLDQLKAARQRRVAMEVFGAREAAALDRRRSDLKRRLAAVYRTLGNAVRASELLA